MRSNAGRDGLRSAHAAAPSAEVEAVVGQRLVAAAAPTARKGFARRPAARLSRSRARRYRTDPSLDLAVQYGVEPLANSIFRRRATPLVARKGLLIEADATSKRSSGRPVPAPVAPDPLA